MTTAPAYEAKTLRHPHARKGKVTEIKGTDAVSGRPFTDYQGEPDVFPDVVVKDPNTEAYYRAQGYIVPGEVPTPPAEYAEYPVMLVHPDHVDAVPDDYAIEKAENGEIIRHKIPGSPEKFAPKQANTAAEEKALGKLGYARAGQDDPEAIRRSKASPHVPGRQTKEFPKMVEGKVVDPDAQQGGPIQYPKWVGDKLVNSRAEEEAITGKKVDAVIDVCIICDEVILASEARAEGKNGPYHLAHMDQTAAPKKAAADPKAPAKAKPAKKAAPAPAPKAVAPASRRAARAAAETKPETGKPEAQTEV